MAPGNFVFTLEALDAKHGDSLLLHFGAPNALKTILIDGGPKGVYTKTLSKRLLALKAARAGNQALPIELAMISHLDDDHIAGMVDLLSKLNDAKDASKPLAFDITELWVNTFDDIVGSADPASVASVASFEQEEVDDHHHDAAAVVATVGQGRTIRNLATQLGITVNANKAKMVQGDSATLTSTNGNLDLRVLLPDGERIDALHVEWDKQVKKNGWAVKPDPANVADYVDNSVYNLSSIVVLATYQKKQILLTGDARGDHIIAAAARSKLWKKKPYTVDIVKVPHHGSDRNLSTDFFETFAAPHYVISADGEYGNPEMATLDMIVEGRGDADYTVHLTNRKGKENLTAKLTKKLASYPKKTRDRFVFRADADPSLRIDLGAPLGAK